MKTKTLSLWFVFALAGLPLEGHPEPVRELNVLAAQIPGASEPGPKGRDIELVLATFKECGFKAKFTMQPYERHARTYRDRPEFDAVMTVPLFWNLPGFATSAYIWYQPGAFYNHTRLGDVESLSDLKGLHVVTFRGGIDVLGLKEKLPVFGSITEIADRTIHSRLLFMGRVDAILADGFVVAEVNRRIFQSKRRREMWPSQSDTFLFAPIFDPVPQRMAFREKSLAKAFDRCFDSLSERGIIDAINDKFIAKYQNVLRFRYLGH